MSKPEPQTTKLMPEELSVSLELKLLSKAQKAFEKMPPAARLRAFTWFKDKYAKEWPRDGY